MVKLPTPSALEIAWIGLLLSISLNLSAIYVFRRQTDACVRSKTVDDTGFSRCPIS